MKPTRPTLLIALVVAATAATWALVRYAYLSLPPLPWTMVPSLLLLALGEAYTAVVTRARIRHKPNTKPMDPLAAARLAALAKASAYAAAVLAGVFGGFLIFLGSSLGKQTPRHDFFVSLGTFLAAVVLIATALFLEYACRVPKDPKDEEQDHRASRT